MDVELKKLKAMKRFLIIIFLAIALINCKKASDVPLSGTELSVSKDSIDSTSSSGDLTGESESAKERLLDNLRGDFNVNDSELELFRDGYYARKEEYPDSVLAPIDSYKDLIGKWLPLRYHDGKYFLQLYCTFQRRWQLADSAMINYYPDGVGAELILGVERNNDSIKVKTTGSRYYFKLVDPKRRIYSFHDGYDNIFLTPLKNAANFPVEHNHCDDFE